MNFHRSFAPAHILEQFNVKIADKTGISGIVATGWERRGVCFNYSGISAITKMNFSDEFAEKQEKWVKCEPFFGIELG